MIGGRSSHPVAAVAGGMAAPLSRARHQALVTLAEQAVPLVLGLLDTAREALLKDRDLLFSLPLTTWYLGTVKDGALDLYDGLLRLRGPDGTTVDFSEDDWMKYYEEETTSTSYAKPVFIRLPSGERVAARVGALARLNCADRIATPLAQAELERFRTLGLFPCHQTVLYHYARLVELLHVAERLTEIVKDPEILSPNVRSLAKQAPRSASAHVEAPRGTLIHHYEVDGDAIVTRANLIVATQQNITSVNQTIALSAERYLTRGDSELLNGIEFGIRCYDPCLSCATHRLGDMKLEVIVRRDGQVIREARR